MALPKARKNGRRWFWPLLLGVPALALIGWGVSRWFFPNAQAGVEITAKVTRGDLPIVVTERGDMESVKTQIAKCQVEGQEGAKIVFLLPEGVKVKKGEVVVRFDADKMRKTVAEQEIKYNTAEGKRLAAKEELDVQRNKAESEIAKAELAKDLAALDEEKYLKGEYIADVKEKESAIKLAERELKEAEEKLDAYRTFVKKGFGTPEQLTQKELEVAQKQSKMASDQDKLMVLKDFMFRRQKKELTFKAADAVRELDRTKSSQRATIAKAEADLKSSEIIAALEKEQFERVKKQLDNAEMKAPADGILSYAQSRYYDPSNRIQVGGVVWPQQDIFQIPELDEMQVKVRIHESKVQKVSVGLKAEIRVEAISGLVLSGTVTKVAALANSEVPWMRGGVKEFDCIVKIDSVPMEVGLKPGFSSQVSIKVKTLANVLMTPIQAVAQHEGKHYAYVSTGGPVERREVTVGENNEKFVEIKDGLTEGEAVCLDARARVNAEFKSAATEKGSAPGTETNPKSEDRNPKQIPNPKT